MNYNKLLFLIPILLFSVAGYLLYTSTMNLTELGERIIVDLETPYDDPTLAEYNHSLTCHKVGLYTDWDEDWDGDLMSYLTGIDVGDRARELFFEYDCSLLCHKYWESSKVCLAELYPYE
jgi:hypothetical protein